LRITNKAGNIIRGIDDQIRRPDYFSLSAPGADTGGTESNGRSRNAADGDEMSQQDEYRYTAFSEQVTTGEGPLKSYMRLAVGSDSYLQLALYELIFGICSWIPGGIGYFLRQKLYRFLFRSFGCGVMIGRNVLFRCPGKIVIGNNVAIEDNCCFDARGEQAQIIVEEKVTIGRNTIFRSRGETIRVGKGASIGANCLFGTDSSLTIGEDVLIAAYCYLSAAGSHNYSDPDLPIIKQGVTRKGGIRVENGAWLGAHTVVLDGVQVGEGAIIGAHSLVNKDQPAKSISFGSPAKVVRYR
jgi:acetyltransferase-like isoleucine patch superfamily enzyme